MARQPLVLFVLPRHLIVQYRRKLEATAGSWIVAFSVEEGMEMLGNGGIRAPDAIVVFLHGPDPDWDGMHLMRMARMFARTKHVPLVAISARESARTAALAAGARAFLLEPVTFEDIRSSVRITIAQVATVK